MVVLDQYRMQEVAFGHAGFLGASTWSVIPLAWLEHHLLTPVMARFATARPVAIQYDLNGKWVDATAAARSEDNAKVWQRVRVRYDNGLTITANQADGAAPRRRSAAGSIRLGCRGSWRHRLDGAFATAWWPTMPRPRTASSPMPAPPAIGTSRAARGSVPRSTALKSSARACSASPTPGGSTKPCHATTRASFISARRAAHEVGNPLPARPRVGSSHLAMEARRTIKDGPHEIRVPESLPDGDYAWTIGLFTPVDGS